MTIEGIRLDIQYVFFYKRKISWFDGTLWHNIYFNPKQIFNFICHGNKIQPHRTIEIYSNIDITIFRSLTTRVRPKHPHPRNGIFPLKFWLMSPQLFQYGV